MGWSIHCRGKASTEARPTLAGSHSRDRRRLAFLKSRCEYLPLTICLPKKRDGKRFRDDDTSPPRPFFFFFNGWPLADDRAALTKQVKEANDIVDVVGGYVALRPAGPTFKGLCPFHDDHRPSFDVDPRRQRYRCWSCGKYGDVISFVQEHGTGQFSRSAGTAGTRAGISLEKTADSPQQSRPRLMLDVMRWAAEQFQQCLLDSPLAEAARRYLGERKLTGETVRRFGLGYRPARGRLAGAAGRGRGAVRPTCWSRSA